MKKNILFIIIIFFLFGFSTPKPKVLIIGDSISIGYFPYVKKELSDVAVLVHNEGNAKYTGNGLNNIHRWVGNTHWDVIQFNWGLWDLAYRKTEGDSSARKLTTSLAQYAKNLDSLVKILKSTHAKLIFVTTSYVPNHSPGRFSADPQRYNQVAKKIMRENGVWINDIYHHSKKVHRKLGASKTNVHYTKEGYKELSIYISRFLKKVIKK